MSLTCDYCKKQVKRLVKLADIPDLRRLFERLQDQDSVCVLCTMKARIVAYKIPKRDVEAFCRKKQKLREAKLKKTNSNTSSNNKQENSEAIDIGKPPNKVQNPVNTVPNPYGIKLIDVFSISNKSFENISNHVSPSGIKTEYCPGDNLNQESNEFIYPNNVEEINFNSSIQNESCFNVEEDVKDPNILLNSTIDLNESILTVILPQNRIDLPRLNASLVNKTSEENLLTLHLNSSTQKNVNNSDTSFQNEIIDHENKYKTDCNLPYGTPALENLTKNNFNNGKTSKSPLITTKTRKQNPKGKVICTLVQNENSSKEVCPLQENTVDDCNTKADEIHVEKYTTQKHNSSKEKKKNSNATAQNKNVTDQLKEKNNELHNNSSLKKGQAVKRKLMNPAEDFDNSLSSDDDHVRESKKLRSSGKNYFKQQVTPPVWKPIRNTLQQMVEISSPESVKNINRNNTKQKQAKSKRNPALPIMQLTKDNLEKCAKMDKKYSADVEDRLSRYFNSTRPESIEINSSISDRDSFNITDFTINDMDRLQENASQEVEIMMKCDELVSKITGPPITSKQKPRNENSSTVQIISNDLVPKSDNLCNNTRLYDDCLAKTREENVIHQESESCFYKEICKNNVEKVIPLDIHEITTINEKAKEANFVRKDDSANGQKSFVRIQSQNLNNDNHNILCAEVEGIEIKNILLENKNESEKLPAKKDVFDMANNMADKMDQNNELNEDLLESVNFRSCGVLPQAFIQNHHIQLNLEENASSGCEVVQKLDQNNIYEKQHSKKVEESSKVIEKDVMEDYFNDSFPLTFNSNKFTEQAQDVVENVVESNEPEIEVAHVLQNLEIPITQLFNKSKDSIDDPKDLLNTINKSLEIMSNISHTGIVKKISANTLSNQNNSLSYVFSLLHKEKSSNPNFVTKLSPLIEISIKRIHWSIECDAALESGVRHKCYKTQNSFEMPVCTVKNCTGGNFIFNFSAVLHSGFTEIELNGQDAHREMLGLSKEAWLDVCCLLYSLGEYKYHNGKLDRTGQPLQASVLDLLIKTSSKIGNLMILYQKVKSRDNKKVLLRSIDASKSFDAWPKTKPRDISRCGLKPRTLEFIEACAKLHNQVNCLNRKVTVANDNITALQMKLDNLEESDIVKRGVLSEEMKKLQSELEQYKRDLDVARQAEEQQKRKYS